MQPLHTEHTLILCTNQTLNIYLDSQGSNDGLSVDQAGVTQVVQACIASQVVLSVTLDILEKCAQLKWPKMA